MKRLSIIGSGIALIILAIVFFWSLPWAFMEGHSEWLVLRDQLRGRTDIVQYLDQATLDGKLPYPLFEPFERVQLLVLVAIVVLALSIGIQIVDLVRTKKGDRARTERKS